MFKKRNKQALGDLQAVVGRGHWEDMKQCQGGPSSCFPRNWKHQGREHSSCMDTVNTAVSRGLTAIQTDGHQQVHLPFPAVVGAGVAPRRSD